MEDFNAKQSSDDTQKLIEQLHAENAALRDENTMLREQLATAETQRAHAQAELSALTDAAHVLQEDREALRSKIS